MSLGGHFQPPTGLGWGSWDSPPGVGGRAGSSPHALFSRISHFLSPHEARVFPPSSGSGVRGLRARETRPCPLPQICHQHSESLLPSNPERDGPAPDLETSSSCRQPEEESAALQAEAGPQQAPSEELEEGASLQQTVVGGSPASPEQALCVVAPAAPGPQDQPAASPSLRALEQVRDPSGWARGTAASRLLSTCVQTPCSVRTGVPLHKSCTRVPGRLSQRAVCCLRVLEAAGPGTRCRLGFC